MSKISAMILITVFITFFPKKKFSFNFNFNPRMCHLQFEVQFESHVMIIVGM